MAIEKFDVPPRTASPTGGVCVVIVGTPSDGDVPTWSAANDQYEPVTPGGGPSPGLALIAEAEPSGTGTVSFTSIPSSYRHLKIVWYGRGSTAANNVAVNLRFNNDSGANYDRERLGMTNTAVAAAGTVAQTELTVGQVTGASASADIAGSGEATIPHYAGTTFQKTAHAHTAYKHGTAAGDQNEALTGGAWRSTSAINRVDVILASGNWESGSIVSLYGFA